MFSRAGFIALVLVLACGIMSCSQAEPPLRAPRPTSVLPTIPSKPRPVPAALATVAPTVVDAPAPSAVVIYNQPPKADGSMIQSSWRAPSGSDTDRWIWENFGFENAQVLTELRWYGGYDPAKGGSGGRVQNFTIDLYTSIPAGTEPNLAEAPAAHYAVGGNAEETADAVLGGVQMYAYRFVLPQPFAVITATTYWVQIEAFQSGDPDWGLAMGTGTLTDGRHFRGGGNPTEGYFKQMVYGDVAIEWLAVADEDYVPVPEVVTLIEDIEAMMETLPPAEEVPVNADGIQEVMLVVSRSGYTPVHFAVKPDIPVRVVFRQLGYVPGGNELTIRWGQRLSTYVLLASLTDTRVIEFTPHEMGEWKFSCPHDWYWGVMTVRE